MKYLLTFLLAATTFCSIPTGARYLIICPNDFITTMEPLVKWKTEKGYLTKIVSTTETGTSSTNIRIYY
jgi:hypothetical protein